jgi:cytochrome b561
MTPAPQLSGVRQTFGDAPVWGGDTWCRVIFGLVVLSVVALLAGVLRLNVPAALSGAFALLFSLGLLARFRLAWAKPSPSFSNEGASMVRRAAKVIQIAVVLFMIILSFTIAG